MNIQDPNSKGFQSKPSRYTNQPLDLKTQSVERFVKGESSQINFTKTNIRKVYKKAIEFLKNYQQLKSPPPLPPKPERIRKKIQKEAFIEIITNLEAIENNPTLKLRVKDGKLETARRSLITIRRRVGTSEHSVRAVKYILEKLAQLGEGDSDISPTLDRFIKNEWFEAVIQKNEQLHGEFRRAGGIIELDDLYTRGKNIIHEIVKYGKQIEDLEEKIASGAVKAEENQKSLKSWNEELKKSKSELERFSRSLEHPVTISGDVIINEEAAKMNTQLLEILSSEDMIDRCTDWLDARKSLQESQSGVMSSYTRAFGATVPFYKSVQTESIVKGHQVLAKNDPGNKDSYEQLIDHVSHFGEACNKVMPVLKECYEKDVGSDDYVPKPDLRLTDRQKQAMTQLRKELVELKEGASDVSFHESEFSSCGELSKDYFNANIDKTLRRLDELQETSTRDKTAEVGSTWFVQDEILQMKLDIACLDLEKIVELKEANQKLAIAEIDDKMIGKLKDTLLGVKYVYNKIEVGIPPSEGDKIELQILKNKIAELNPSGRFIDNDFQLLIRRDDEARNIFDSIKGILSELERKYNLEPKGKKEEPDQPSLYVEVGIPGPAREGKDDQYQRQQAEFIGLIEQAGIFNEEGKALFGDAKKERINLLNFKVTDEGLLEIMDEPIYQNEGENLKANAEGVKLLLNKIIDARNNGLRQVRLEKYDNSMSLNDFLILYMTKSPIFSKCCEEFKRLYNEAVVSVCADEYNVKGMKLLLDGLSPIFKRRNIRKARVKVWLGQRDGKDMFGIYTVSNIRKSLRKVKLKRYLKKTEQLLKKEQELDHDTVLRKMVELGKGIGPLNDNLRNFLMGFVKNQYHENNPKRKQLAERLERAWPSGDEALNLRAEWKEVLNIVSKAVNKQDNELPEQVHEIFRQTGKLPLVDLRTNTLSPTEKLHLLEKLQGKAGLTLSHLTKDVDPAFTISLEVKRKESLHDPKRGIISTLKDSPVGLELLDDAEERGVAFYEITIRDDQRSEDSPSAARLKSLVSLKEKLEDNDFANIYRIDEEISIARLTAEEPWPNTMVLRIAEDGSFAELGTFEKQSDKLSGDTLMKIADHLFTFLGPKTVYLHDLSNIKSEEKGSYPLRTFRYFGQQTSWYQDKHGYQMFHHLGGTKIEPVKGDPAARAIQPFKERLMEQVREDLENPGFPKRQKEKVLALIEEHVNDCKTMEDIAKKLGAQVREGKIVHDKLRVLLQDYLDVYRRYTGVDEAIGKLRENAKIFKAHEFYCKKFSV